MNINKSNTIVNLRRVNVARQKGFGLLEIGLALLIVAGLGIVAYNAYSDTNLETKLQSEKADMTLVFANAQHKFINQGDYSNATTAVLISNGVFLKSMVSGTSALNRFQGAITVQPATLLTANDGLAFISPKYSAEACRSVPLQLSKGVRTIAINGTPVLSDGGAVDLAALGSACTAGGANNTITYTIGK